MEYASGTSVSVERTKSEIELTLRRYGATQFVSGWDSDQGRAYVGFHVSERTIKFVLTLPRSDDPLATHTPQGRLRCDTDAQRHWEQMVKQKWRALLLVIKAKLESVNGGIETIEEAFMPQIVLPGGGTMGEWAAKAIPQAYASGKMPKSILMIGTDRGE